MSGFLSWETKSYPEFRASPRLVEKEPLPEFSSQKCACARSCAVGDTNAPNIQALEFIKGFHNPILRSTKQMNPPHDGINLIATG